MRIVVTLPIFADFVREIAGDQAEVVSLIPPGADPHTYVPSGEEALAAMAGAQIFLYNGMGLDAPAVEFARSNLPDRPPLLVDFGGNVPSPSTQQPLGRPIYADQAGDDPHLFLDPLLARIYPETVQDSLVIRDTINKAYYDARFAVYRAILDDLHEELTQTLAAIPNHRRGLIVMQHGSLVHFANRYGLTVLGTLEEDGEERLSQLIANHRPVVFVESGLDSTRLRELAEDAGSTICELYTDSIPRADMTYLQMMRHNAAELVRCLAP